jgi:hypothetical protein
LKCCIIFTLSKTTKHCEETVTAGQPQLDVRFTGMFLEAAVLVPQTSPAFTA